MYKKYFCFLLDIGLNLVCGANLEVKQAHEDLRSYKERPSELELKCDISELSSQGDTGIVEKPVVVPVIDKTSTDEIIYNTDEDNEKQSRLRLIENKCESSTCFQERSESHNIKMSASDSTCVSEFIGGDTVRDTGMLHIYFFENNLDIASNFSIRNIEFHCCTNFFLAKQMQNNNCEKYLKNS